MLLAGGASLLGGGAYVGGAFDRGEYYPIAPASVESRLAGLSFGEEGRDADARLVLRSRGPAVVRWDLMIDGKRVADVRAHMEPEAPGTRVDIEFAFTSSAEMKGLDTDPFLKDIAEIAMEEKVDSTLDERPFDETRLAAKMMSAVASDPKAFAAFQKKLEAAEKRRGFDDYDTYSRDRNRYDGTTVRPTASTKPTASAKPARASDVNDTHADGGWGTN
jgi:hypothetical protein